MLLHTDSQGGGNFVAAHVTDFASAQAAWRWRRSAPRGLPAYRDVEGHGATVRRDPPILTEQLNARLRVRRLDGNWGQGTIYPQKLAQLAAALSSEGGG